MLSEKRNEKGSLEFDGKPLDIHTYELLRLMQHRWQKMLQKPEWLNQSSERKQKKLARNRVMWSDEAYPSCQLKDKREKKEKGWGKSKWRTGGVLPGFITSIITHTWARRAWVDSEEQRTWACTHTESHANTHRGETNARANRHWWETLKSHLAHVMSWADRLPKQGRGKKWVKPTLQESHIN